MQQRMDASAKMLLSFVAVLGLLANTAGGPFHQSPTSAPSQKGSGGAYRITAHGKQIGAEHFQAVTSGDQMTLTSSAQVTVGDVQQKIESGLDLDKGNAVHYSVETGAGATARKYTLTFDAGVAKAKIESTGHTAERTIKVPSGVVVLDKDVWRQYGVLFAKYDMQKKGVQTFAALTPVPALREYRVEVEFDKPATFESSAGKITVNRFFVRLAEGLGLVALVSLDNTPVEMELPTQDIKITLQ
ncbi:MAG TPA: hypothetical protein VLZ81_08770 [Blastocatellia bacterium]|nr:hypothetical protein [Blastocatellia bacterium]